MIDNKYDKENYITAHLDLNWWKAHVNTRILNKYSKLITGKCADIGCNHGACTFIASEVTNASSILGIDLNTEAMLLGEQTFRPLCPTESKVSFLKSFATQIDLDSESFDTVLSLHMLEHLYLEDAKKFLNEAYRLLKVDGYFIVSVPGPTCEAYRDPCHELFFTEESLTDIVANENFKLEDMIIEDHCITGLFKKEKK